MTLTMTSTSEVIEIDGSPARIWVGTTADGYPCRVAVRRLAFDAGNPDPALMTEMVYEGEGYDFKVTAPAPKPTITPAP